MNGIQAKSRLFLDHTIFTRSPGSTSEVFLRPSAAGFIVAQRSHGFKRRSRPDLFRRSRLAA
jgi:hypothetical protein